MMPEAFISMLEYKMAPRLRSKRIGDSLVNLNWYYLMLDLTPSAIKERMIQVYGRKDWAKLVQSEPCKVSMRKAGWHPALFE